MNVLHGANNPATARHLDYELQKALGWVTLASAALDATKIVTQGRTGREDIVGSPWDVALLKAVGAPVTPKNQEFLQTWQRWEGGATHNDASYNWLNTTHGPGRDINSVGVKAFPNFATGIRSLAQTLQNGRYPSLLASPEEGGSVQRGRLG